MHTREWRTMRHILRSTLGQSAWQAIRGRYWRGHIDDRLLKDIAIACTAYHMRHGTVGRLVPSGPVMMTLAARGRPQLDGEAD